MTDAAAGTAPTDRSDRLVIASSVEGKDLDD